MLSFPMVATGNKKNHTQCTICRQYSLQIHIRFSRLVAAFIRGPAASFILVYSNGTMLCSHLSLRKWGPIAHSLSLSTSHHPVKTEILLKRMLNGKSSLYHLSPSS